ncbi:MAG: hypothetical protein WCH39_03260 [Schlesneria sp.]
MREFFQSWRRKIGVVTLLMACVLMGGWMRNYFIRDSVNIPTGSSSSIEFISRYQCLNLVVMWSSIPDSEMASFRIYHQKEEEEIGFPAGKFLFGGFARDHFPFRPSWFSFSNEVRTTSLMIFSLPYWSITIPLTLLSGWLLLSKPRQPQSKAPVEPISETVA